MAKSKCSEATPIPQTREEIGDFLEENKNLIHSILQEFLNSGMEYDDMFQEASIGFLKGIETFTENKGVLLTTYCYKCAQNNVRMMLRKSRSKGRRAYVSSLDAVFVPDGKDKEANPGDVLSTSNADQLHVSEDSIEDQVTKREMARIAMNYAKECLTDQEYQVLVLWFNGYTQDQIASEMKISQASASKLIHFGFPKLQWYLHQKGFIGNNSEK